MVAQVLREVGDQVTSLLGASSTQAARTTGMATLRDRNLMSMQGHLELIYDRFQEDENHLEMIGTEDEMTVAATTTETVDKTTATLGTAIDLSRKRGSATIGILQEVLVQS